MTPSSCPFSEEPAPDMIPGRTPHRQAGWYRVLAAVAALLIAMLIGVTCIDVIGRYLMNRPFGAAYELTQILLAALVFVALPLTSADGGHVEVDLALHLFPKWLQDLLGRLAGIVSAVVLGYFTWRLALLGVAQMHEGTHSASLLLPMAPLAFLAAGSCALSAVVMLLPKGTP
ncbi:Tripartite ATP-independent transporter, DctQ component [Paracoccus thiocyanatus]|uniref:TRAP transporter small permease protein n=1 Tax=Paracoccus thiocyanatus TaxID=34006 RepID=A0A1N6YVJ2_9RHOB|nr:TRAP transporter small permease [Paracoccus thiocyanatus]SIR18597.1 Tripartite ATP-independent transporter, DctQ component [Paracoccus thiocyanatus]